MESGTLIALVWLAVAAVPIAGMGLGLWLLLRRPHPGEAERIARAMRAEEQERGEWH